jgi:serine/threonine-protein phosphatase 6 regulatory ankyrin repeat subunit B
MQTGLITSTTTRPLQTVSVPTIADSDITSAEGKNIVTYSYPAAPQIGLMALPVEILAYLMKTMDDPRGILNLSFTCQHSQEAYHHQYKAHEHQYHMVIYYRSTFSLPSILISKKRTAIPPHKIEAGNKLKNYSLDANLEARKLALIQKIYPTAWDLLLNSPVINSHQQASELMKILLDLLPHINHVEDYTAQLFPQGFPEKCFIQLADIHLDRCLQLVLNHFDLPQARQFIIDQCPFYNSPADLSDLYRIKNNRYPSFLHYAIAGVWGEKYEKSDAMLELLFKQGCDLEQTNRKGETALDYALNILERGQGFTPQVDRILQVARRLIEQGASWHGRGKGDITLLMIIASIGSQQTLQALLSDESLDVNVKNKDGETALHYAVARNNLFIIQELLAHPKIEVNARNYQGKSALHYAIRCNNLCIVQALLAHPRIDVNIKNDRGYSFLNYAIETDNLCIVQELLRARQIDINGKDNHGNNVLIYAIHKGHLSMVSTLLQQPHIAINAENNEGDKVVHHAVKADVCIAKAVFKHPQIEINARNHQGESPLHIAVAGSNLPMVKILLQQKNIDVNAKNLQGDVALHIAIVRSDWAMVELLIQHPTIDVNTKNAQGDSGLYMAIMRSDLPIVQLLIQHPQIDINAINEKEESALVNAVVRGDLLMVNMLLPHPNIDVSTKNREGDSALHLAIQRDDLPIIKTLLNISYRVTSLLAFNYALSLGKDEIASIFLQEMTPLGKSAFINDALTLAQKEGQLEIAEVLYEEYEAHPHNRHAFDFSPP